MRHFKPEWGKGFRRRAPLPDCELKALLLSHILSYFKPKLYNCSWLSEHSENICTWSPGNHFTYFIPRWIKPVSLKWQRTMEFNFSKACTSKFLAYMFLICLSEWRRAMKSTLVHIPGGLKEIRLWVQTSDRDYRLFQSQSLVPLDLVSEDTAVCKWTPTNKGLGN